MPSPEEQTYRQAIMARFDGIDASLEKLDVKVGYTNGKVRKIIIALAIVVGIIIGQTFTNTHDIITLLASAL